MSLVALLCIILGSLLLAGAAAALWVRVIERRSRQSVLPVEEGDRREDVDTRARISVLEERWRRTARHLFIAVTVLGAGLTAAVAILFVLFGQLHDSRVRSLRESCERNRNTVVTASARYPALTSFFRQAFPYSDDCQAEAEARANRR
jgi:hypothetical protein